jgi:hypothetical protein
LNYAFIKQINWESTFNDTAWITGLNGEVIYIEDNADNRINNLPAHLIKAHWNKALAHNLLIHLDTRIALDYQQKDMLDIFSAAHQEYGNPVTIEEMENLKDAMEDEGYAQASFTSSMGLSWKKTLGDMEFETSIFARNLLSYNQLRYIIQYWETGNLRQYPRQCGFIKEPLDISLQLTLKF